MNWSVIAAAVAASVMSLTLMSGKALINFNHTPNLTAITQDSTFKVAIQDGHPAIYLSDVIESPNDYKNLIMYINAHKDESDMYVYLSGNGGQVSSALNLINTMKSSEKTKFHIVVYGDVYSAHAVLAMSGDSLTILNKNIVFLFHVPAIKNKQKENVTLSDSCDLATGMDRGITIKHKCQNYAKKLNAEFDSAMTLALSIMTPEEKEAYYAGDDIMLTGGEVESRLTKLKVGKKNA